MAGRPYWSGQIQISLVSFGVRLYTAIETKSEIRFHQINRKTGERVRYQKVNNSEAEEIVPQEKVEKDEIVKGYEYRKGEYIQIEPEEIEQLRIPSKSTIEIKQFVNLTEVDPGYFERPLFVVPENAAHAEAFAVVREALKSMGKAGLGKIAFGGREHLVAVAAGNLQQGMMAYILRYAEELRDLGEYFKEIPQAKIENDQLKLAKELIRQRTAQFEPDKWHDEYEAALRELVDSKLKHLPLPNGNEAHRASGKVVNLMDALRASVADKDTRLTRKKPPVRASGEKLALIKNGRASDHPHATRRHKTA